MPNRIDVGILGSTGVVGQTFISLLERHPWFKVTWLGASERSAGKSYDSATRWRLPSALPEAVASMTIDQCVPGTAPQLVFSGLDSAVAGDIESEFARAGHTIVSNSRNFRMADDVPLLIPEVNPDHLGLLSVQADSRKWPGRIVTNPNCSTIILALALAPLRDFGLTAATVSTLQAVSGAGYPGVSSLDMVGNVIPFIDGEEDKLETETQKVLGTFNSDRVLPHPIAISAQATRVPVVNGHTELVSVKMASKVSLDELTKTFKQFRGQPQEKLLPSAPSQPIMYAIDKFRPTPRLDVNNGDAMAVTIGRLRSCHVLDYKFVVLGHNTVRGAAGAALLNAELMQSEGLLT